MQSENSKRAYRHALTDFGDWHSHQRQPALNKALLNDYKAHLLAMGKSAGIVYQSLWAIRKLVREAADNGMVNLIHTQGIDDYRHFCTLAGFAGQRKRSAKRRNCCTFHILDNGRYFTGVYAARLYILEDIL